eukprot:GILI01053824.1.p1 GENE.GILI01053824.1~~GILI01053824.1.p1  ORF type:complete len:173 (+),score=14.77 GILI01053824.1:44-520(+)
MEENTDDFTVAAVSAPTRAKPSPKEETPDEQPPSRKYVQNLVHNELRRQQKYWGKNDKQREQPADPNTNTPPQFSELVHKYTELKAHIGDVATKLSKAQEDFTAAVKQLNENRYQPYWRNNNRGRGNFRGQSGGRGRGNNNRNPHHTPVGSQENEQKN